MNKKIMILGASILQLPAIKKAHEMGLDVVAVDMNPNAIGFEESYVTKEVISTIDVPKVVDAAKKHNIDAVITLASDMPMRSVAAVAKELNLVGISEETALNATNKAEMRKCLQQSGVPIPQFYKVSDQSEFEEAIRRFDKPFIIKPADNSGSRGIFLVEDIKDIEFAKNAYLYSKQNSRSGDVVVEEYMRGPEVSVETLSVDGVCHVIQITDKLTTGAPHFVEMGHSQPSRLEQSVLDRICEVAIDANIAVGIKNGPSHTEIIVTEEGPKIVELGARLGGDCITTHLVPLSTGVDMVECCIKIALGEKPDLETKYHKGSAIRYLSQTSGTVMDINGIPDAESTEGVVQISFVYDVGDKVTEVDSSSARLGFIIAQRDNVKQAIISCEEAASKINVLIE